MKYPALIRDTFLSGGFVTKTSGGKPKFWSGGFSIVFQIDTGGELWAFKVWHTELKDNKFRYTTVSEVLEKCALPYFTEFEYVENGVLVDGVLMDTHRMPWVDGAPLKDYINSNITNPVKLANLASKFQLMVAEFHKHNIAHGDLQHGNIIVQDDGEISVIDYDSFFVEGLQGLPDLIKGQGGYQHPSRYYNLTINEKLDYFSELVIYTSLIVYSEHPELWSYDTDWLLFSKEDLETPELCTLFMSLKKSDNPKIAILMSTMHEFLRCEDITQLLPLEDIINSKINAKFPPLDDITDKF
ncbi:AarF/UbiB family protein [Pedobacter sp. HMWF019]|uniref:AarF/UbiB family protein n=1 Tax=Pedobacter sp. HMWF019 TaxID=2056856 RepID=UPI0011B21FA7|nr:AarF/UbiB family protein [Pedobacter sp. HMWF019]